MRHWLMVTVKVSPKFQVVIPKTVRERLSIRPGQKLQILQFSDRIEFVLLQKIKRMRGFLKGIRTNVRREKDRI
jgi:AbrB family looped-hinge helix DNA binding protein